MQLSGLQTNAHLYVNMHGYINCKWFWFNYSHTYTSEQYMRSHMQLQGLRKQKQYVLWQIVKLIVNLITKWGVINIYKWMQEGVAYDFKQNTEHFFCHCSYHEYAEITITNTSRADRNCVRLCPHLLLFVNWNGYDCKIWDFSNDIWYLKYLSENCFLLKIVKCKCNLVSVRPRAKSGQSFKFRRKTSTIATWYMHTGKLEA